MNLVFSFLFSIPLSFFVTTSSQALDTIQTETSAPTTPKASIAKYNCEYSFYGTGYKLDSTGIFQLFEKSNGSHDLEDFGIERVLKTGDGTKIKLGIICFTDSDKNSGCVFPVRDPKWKDTLYWLAFYFEKGKSTYKNHTSTFYNRQVDTSVDLSCQEI